MKLPLLLACSRKPLLSVLSTQVGYEPLPRLDGGEVLSLLPSMKVLSEGGMSRVYAASWYGKTAVVKCLKARKSLRLPSPLPDYEEDMRVVPDEFDASTAALVELSGVPTLPHKPRRGSPPIIVAELRREANMARDIARAGIKCCAPVACVGWGLEDASEGGRGTGLVTCAAACLRRWWAWSTMSCHATTAARKGMGMGMGMACRCAWACP